MRLVILDGFALNPGDLSWSALEELAEITYYDRTAAEEIVLRCKDTEGILTNKAPLDRATLDQLPNLKYIGVTATGYNMIDVAACRERGIVISNVPAYSTNSVAQLVFAFILEHCHHVALHSDLVRQGQWSRAKDFAFWRGRLIELDGMTLGIVGFGNIGRQVAAIAKVFGMKVLATSRTPKSEPGVEFVDTKTLFSQSDFITLHCPLTPETQGMVNKESLNLMKEAAFLVNTGRGPLIVEQDLADALNAGRIAGAGLDVLSVEPPPESNPLLSADSCFVTPHIAWATKAARERLMATTVANLRAFREGQPQNVVS